MPAIIAFGLNCLPDPVAGKEPLPFGTLSRKWRIPPFADNLHDMTIVYENLRARSPLHILIIAVGRFEGNQLEDLPGVCESATRVTQFWQNPVTRVLGHQLGSIDLLMSPCAAAPDIMGVQGQSIERASLGNVRAAFGRWVDRCAQDPDSGAMLHWIGHGAQEFSLGDGQRNRLLYCDDYDADVGRQRAVQLSLAVQSLRCTTFSDRALLFIDTCRDEIDHDTFEEYPSPLPDEPRFEVDGPVVNDVVCLGLRYPGDRTRSYTDPSPECGFMGGALFTEALLDAIRTFGAERVSPGGAWFSRGDTLPAAMDARLELWRDHLHFAKALGVALSGEYPWTIAEVSRPAAMIRVDVEERRAGLCPQGDICLVHVEAEGFATPEGGCPAATLRRRDERKVWRGDIPAGWWRPTFEGEPARPPFKSLPPKCDAHWII